MRSVVPFHTVKGLILLDGQLNGKPATFLLDTSANNSTVDVHSAGFDGLKLDALCSRETPEQRERVPSEK